MCRMGKINFFFFVAVSFVAFAESCQTTYSRGCCTTTVIYNYCGSAASKNNLKTIIKEQPNSHHSDTNKWGKVIIPAPRDKRDCPECSVPFDECFHRYNDYAMETGDELLILEQLTEIGQEPDIEYRRKRQENFDEFQFVEFENMGNFRNKRETADKSTNTTTGHGNLTLTGKKIIKPSSLHARTTVSPPKGRVIITPSYIRTNALLDSNTIKPPPGKVIIPAHRFYTFSENKTLDMSRVLVSFLFENKSKIVNVSTSVGNFDSIFKFIQALKEFITPETLKELQDFVIVNGDSRLFKRVVVAWGNQHHDDFMKFLLRNPKPLKDALFEQPYLNTILATVTSDDVEKLITGNLPQQSLSYLIRQLIVKHPGYIASALSDMDMEPIKEQLKKINKLETFTDKFK